MLCNIVKSIKDNYLFNLGEMENGAELKNQHVNEKEIQLCRDQSQF